MAYSQFLDTMPDVVWKPVDGSGPAEGLIEMPDAEFPNSFSPDGQVLIFGVSKIGDGSQALKQLPHGLWQLTPGRDEPPRPWLTPPFPVAGARFSPDGEWVVYVSTEEDTENVYIRPFPGPGPAIKISLDGGTDPRWHPHFPKTPELFYRKGGALLVAEGVGLDEQPAGAVRQLLEGDYPIYAWDVAHDGQRFLMVQLVEDKREPVTELTAVVNWFDELHRLAPDRGKP